MNRQDFLWKKTVDEGRTDWPGGPDCVPLAPLFYRLLENMVVVFWDSMWLAEKVKTKILVINIFLIIVI